MSNLSTQPSDTTDTNQTLTPGASDMSIDAVCSAIEQAQQHLLGLQHPDGYWVLPLGADSTLPADYIQLLFFLHLEKSDRIPALARGIRNNQLPDGGWSIYPGGPAEISASVKGYFALKLAGVSPDEPDMVLARQTILRQGGLSTVNTFTKIYLAFQGLYPWEGVPAIPPELILLPRWVPVNYYEMSSWSRTIIVPLSIIWAHRPVRPVPDHATLDELWVPGTRAQATRLQRDPRLFTWYNFFIFMDRLIKRWDATRWRPLRGMALAAAERWTRDRIEGGDGLGAIYPAMVNSVVALECLGYSKDDPIYRRAIETLEGLERPEGDALYMQPCHSPVWDTAITSTILAESGLDPYHTALESASDWLIDREVREVGDWYTRRPGVTPSGWFFEFDNRFYPDVDDTAQVMMALQRIRVVDTARKAGAMVRGLEWILHLQNRKGGWAAFDVDLERELLTKVPFADHNAMLDPTCPDITGRVLEMLSGFGYHAGDVPVDRAIRYLKNTQEHDGSWYGRWGINYIYGTWLALRGLRAVGQDMNVEWCQRAADWLERVQQADGSWGESAATYDDPMAKGLGTSTPTQTAWAIMGLIAAGRANRSAVQRGVNYLLRTQRVNGGWDEVVFTGTGFPKVFYLEYPMYRLYFPLQALSQTLAARGLLERVAATSQHVHAIHHLSDETEPVIGANTP